MIYTEWLTATKDYEFAAGYCVEYYGNPMNYENGTADENYYCDKLKTGLTLWVLTERSGFR